MAPGSRQRRAIYTVLQQWLSEAQLIEALAVFQERYQGRSSIGMHDYLAEIAALYSDRVDLKTVRRNLMRMLIANEAELAPDPLPKLPRCQGPAASRLTPSNELTLAQRALHDLLSQLREGMPKARQRVLQERLAVQLKTARIKRSREVMAEYLKSQDPTQLVELGEDRLQDLLTLFYSATCEAFGPVETDGLLAQALEKLRTQNPKGRAALDRFL